MFLKIGHRGARAYETENTIDSFKKAIELGANAVEMDVRLSKDNKLIVCHDDNLKKVFGIDAFVSDSTLYELKQLTANKIVTLQEALQFTRGKVDKVLVELKDAGYERDTLQTITDSKIRGKAIIVSFHEGVLETVRGIDKEIETGLIYTKLKKPVEAALRLGAQYLVALYRFVHTRVVEKAHKNNLRVIVWTINTKDEALKYIAKGIDGIASDRPDILSD